MKVLIVEDEAVSRFKLQKIVKEYCDCVAVESGEAALEIAWSGRPPDLILLDIALPGIDGYEVCARLKADCRTADIPLIFITGKKEKEAEVRGLELGAVDYIAKPFKRAIVKARLRTHLELQQHRTRLEELVRERTIGLVKAKKEAEAASRIKTEFLRNINHEVKTPLQGIIGTVDLLSATDLTPLQQKYIRLLQRSGDRLQALIDDILDFSVLENETIRLAPERISLQKTVGEVLEIKRFPAEKKGLGLTLRIEENVPDEISVDPRRLRQVLIYLLDNSIKFTETGEVGLRVVSRDDPAPDRILLQFTLDDTGIGVAPDKKEMIFESFTQADGSTRRRHQGAGLGLTIASRLVKHLGGDLWLEQKTGPGAVFHFTILAGR